MRKYAKSLRKLWEFSIILETLDILFLLSCPSKKHDCPRTVPQFTIPIQEVFGHFEGKKLNKVIFDAPWIKVKPFTCFDFVDETNKNLRDLLITTHTHTKKKNTNITIRLLMTFSEYLFYSEFWQLQFTMKIEIQLFVAVLHYDLALKKNGSCWCLSRNGTCKKKNARMPKFTHYVISGRNFSNFYFLRKSEYIAVNRIGPSNSLASFVKEVEWIP